MAQPGFNRRLVPPYVVAIYLCIGLTCGFSIFWLPLRRVIGIANPVVCKSMTLGQALITTSGDWRVSDRVWTYSIFFVVLGTSAAIWGGWLERARAAQGGRGRSLLLVRWHRDRCGRRRIADDPGDFRRTAHRSPGYLVRSARRRAEEGRRGDRSRGVLLRSAGRKATFALLTMCGALLSGIAAPALVGGSVVLFR